LFEQITGLDEYYPSRTEKVILRRYAAELMHGVEEVSLVELGSGDCSKISILLRAMPGKAIKRTTYVPVDVSPSAMEETRHELQEKFAGIEVNGIVADFTRPFRLDSRREKRIFCFFGSTIGNLDRQDAVRLVARLGRMMKTGDRLLLGLDMVKDKTILERAYNDKGQLTARFNKNILKVANRIARTDFHPEHFRHLAFFNEEQQRIEMHLVATRDMIVRSPLLEGNLVIRKNETIHTENSHKFTLEHIGEFATSSGLSAKATYTDSNRWFTLVCFAKQSPPEYAALSRG